MSDTKYDIGWLKSAVLADLKTALRDPLAREQVNLLLRTKEGASIAAEMINDKDYVPISKRAPEPGDEEAIAADVALADQQAAADAAQAEVDRHVVEVAVVPPVVEKKKIVIDYQVTAEDGTPIGRPTHIEGWSNEEINEKLKAAHINAVRYAERMKTGRSKSIEAQAQTTEAQQRASKSQAEADEAIIEASKDTTKLPDAIKKSARADREAEIAAQSARQHGKIIADVWMADHKEDFLPCDANQEIMGNYFKENHLEFTYDNLENAFGALYKKLAKPEIRVAAEETPVVLADNSSRTASAAPAVAAPLIPAASVTVAETVPAAVSASQPIPTATVSTPAASVIPTPAARRPGVNASLPPGSLSAQRPSESAQPVETTRAQLLKLIAKMPREEYRLKLKSDKFVAQLRAAGIPVVGAR